LSKRDQHFGFPDTVSSNTNRCVLRRNLEPPPRAEATRCPAKENIVNAGNTCKVIAAGVRGGHVFVNTGFDRYARATRIINIASSVIVHEAIRTIFFYIRHTFVYYYIRVPVVYIYIYI